MGILCIMKGQKDPASKDLIWLVEICTVMSHGGSFMASFENCLDASLPAHRGSFDRTDFEQRRGPHPRICEICQHGGTNQHEEHTDPKSLRRKCFRDFLVLEFILMRVLKSGKMIGGQILCSFFVSDDNIEFLEQKDPPHQVMVCWHEKLVRNACFFCCPRTAPIAKSLASHISSKGKSQSGAIKIGASVNFLTSSAVVPISSVIDLGLLAQAYARGLVREEERDFSLREYGIND
ncbi:hypothetical protein Tco_0109763 [Tanacetum coccineum]